MDLWSSPICRSVFSEIQSNISLATGFIVIRLSIERNRTTVFLTLNSIFSVFKLAVTLLMSFTFNMMPHICINVQQSFSNNTMARKKVTSNKSLKYCVTSAHLVKRVLLSTQVYVIIHCVLIGHTH